MNYIDGTSGEIIYQCIECGVDKGTVHQVNEPPFNVTAFTGLCDQHYNAARDWMNAYMTMEEEWTRSENEYRRLTVSLDRVLFTDDDGYNITLSDLLAVPAIDDEERPITIQYTAHKNRYRGMKDWCDSMIKQKVQAGWKDTRIQTFFRKQYGLDINRLTIRRSMQHKAPEIEEVYMTTTTPLGLPIPVGYTQAQRRFDWFLHLYQTAETNDAKARIYPNLEAAYLKLTDKERGNCDARLRRDNHDGCEN